MASLFAVPVTLAAMAGTQFYYSQQSVMSKFLNDSEMENYFQKFISFTGRNFKSTEEYQMRFSIFEENFNKIQAHNEADEHPFKLAMNYMGDWTHEEYQERLGFMSTREKSVQSRGEISEETANALPKSVNWVEKGAVQAIKNQGSCGSCWTFSATSAVESAWYVKNGELLDLDVPS